MIDKVFAQQFASDWIDAWNDHDLERLLRHFSDDFEAWAPAISLVTHDSAGVLRGKAAVMASLSEARQLIPEVRFELISTLVGETSVTLYYKGVRGRLAAETFCFGPDLKVVSVLTMLGEALAAWAISARRAA
jgi:ketosteroid isomerase-like protein